MAAYEKYLSGGMTDLELSSAKVQEALKDLPKVGP
jgi:hypothetical protein